MQAVRRDEYFGRLVCVFDAMRPMDREINLILLVRS